VYNLRNVQGSEVADTPEGKELIKKLYAKKLEKEYERSRIEEN
jgi:hypothetical protein